MGHEKIEKKVVVKVPVTS